MGAAGSGWGCEHQRHARKPIHPRLGPPHQGGGDVFFVGFEPTNYEATGLQPVVVHSNLAPSPPFSFSAVSPRLLTNGITRVILSLVKTAISVPDRVFRSAEELAARLRVSRSELYSNALAEFIEKHKNDVTTARLNEVYAKNREQSTLEPEIALLQYHTTKRNT